MADPGAFNPMHLDRDVTGAQSILDCIMCMMVYLSAAQPLRIVPLDEADPTIHVSPLIPADESVQEHFPNSHAVCAGAYEGCGCGFQYGEYPDGGSDPLELDLKRRSLDELARYLRGEIARVGHIAVYACWDGDQACTPELRRRLSPSDLEKNDFFFRQKELSVFVADAEVSAG